MFKQFRPKQRSPRAVEPSEIAALFEKGDFKRAYRYCREGGYQLDTFSASLAKMGRRMYYSRPAELASLIYKYKINVGLDVSTILKSQFAKRDHHGFLKNVHRFGLLGDFKAEVQEAINSLNRSEEAQSWRAKFEGMVTAESLEAPPPPPMTRKKPRTM